MGRRIDWAGGRWCRWNYWTAWLNSSTVEASYLCVCVHERPTGIDACILSLHMDPYQHSFMLIYSIFLGRGASKKESENVFFGVNSAAGAMGLNLCQHRSAIIKCEKLGSRCRRAENGDWN